MVASFGDLLVMLVAGKPDTRKQQDFISRAEQFTPSMTPNQQFGRPYQSLAQFDGLQVPSAVRTIGRVMSVLALPFRLVAAPFRAIAKIGEYDARRTR